MQRRVTLEICVDSPDSALAAERAGADRVELCSDLACGGITPTQASMRAARRLQIPIHVLVRPRAGDFSYSDAEFQVMRQSIREAKQFGVEGFVLGILLPNNEVDVERTRALVELARPLPVTFHRAFDSCPQLESSLDDVIRTGATRLLTSGGKATAVAGLHTLAGLVQFAGERITIMPCGVIRSENVARVVETTSAREVHSSAGALTGDESERSLQAFEEEVGKLADRLRQLSPIAEERLR